MIDLANEAEVTQAWSSVSELDRETAHIVAETYGITPEVAYAEFLNMVEFLAGLGVDVSSSVTAQDDGSYVDSRGGC